MGQKLLLIIILLNAVFSAPVEFGRITFLKGTAIVSRNSDLLPARQAARLYLNDYLIVSLNSSVIIRGEAVYKVTGNTKLHIQNPPVVEYGSFRQEPLPESPLAQKSLSTALGLTLVFPGSGHWYVKDYPKAVPMTVATSYLLWNIFTINPGISISKQEYLANQKLQFQQIYLIYLAAALLDVYSVTNKYNQKISEDIIEDDAFKDELQVTPVSYVF